MADLGVFYTLGVALVFAGIVVVIIAIIRASVDGKGKTKSETHAAGVILIGPIPLVFGTDKQSVKFILALTLAVTVVVLVMLIVYYLLLR